MSQFPRLLDILQLEKDDNDIFHAESLDIGSPRIYGGQVLAQSIVAANHAIDDEKVLNSIHGYFLTPGDIECPITYKTEVIKEGRSFNNIRVRAKQKDRTIFIAALSYHKPEAGVAHQQSMPNVAQPESLTSFSELFAQFAEKFEVKPRGIFSDDSPLIFHPVEHYDPFNPGKRPAINHTWFKINGEYSAKVNSLQEAIITYASDFNLLITALMPHDISLFTTPMQLASLDHAMWFHSEVDLQDWILYVVESPNSGGGRGFCTGRMYSRQGKLIASVTQEGLIRKF